MPSPQPPSNRLVAALVYDQLCSFEFGCAVEVFGLPRPEFGENWYRFVTCAAEPGPLRAMGGFTVESQAGLDVLAGAGTVIIPGWRGAEAPPSEELIAALRAAYDMGARLVTICSGVFVLAATGLLDGQRVTTHWRYADKLKALYPKLHVDPNVLYVDSGQILTSAGSAAGLDLCVHLVRRDFGAAIANQVARRLVIAPHRNGGQAQFIERPVLPQQYGRLADLIARLNARLHEPLTVDSMAKYSAMSPRTFMRRFQEATGKTPAEWLIEARVERARELLEGTALSIEEIAQRCGFGTAATLRHHFRRRLQVSPIAYRQRFMGDPDAAPEHGVPTRTAAESDQTADGVA
jgi:AraC family transcriptional regulator, transcriptional activator FtrA